MKFLIVTSILLYIFGNISEIDFGSQRNKSNWYVLNDGVMGGLSSGKLEKTKNSIVFSGAVSLENNGGFASIRSEYSKYNLSKFNTIEVRYKSKDYDFAIVLEKNKLFYMPNFKYSLPNTKNTWKTIKVELTKFKAFSLGRDLGYNLDEKLKNEIIRMGFISNEKRAGDYQIEIDYIKFK